MGTTGRDHWGNAMFCFLAGGGLNGGEIVSSTNRLGEARKRRASAAERQPSHKDGVLGVDPSLYCFDHAGRPVAAINHGDVIQERF